MKKIVSLILALMMIISVMPISVQAASTTHSSHPICGSSCADGNGHTNINWKSLPIDALELSSGYYYLDDDLTLSNRFGFKITGDVFICLNGKVMSQTNSSSCFSVEGNGSLTVCDCVGTGKLYIPESNIGNGCICLNQNGSLSLYSGTIESEAISAIYCYSTGNLCVYGGTVIGDVNAIRVHEINDIMVSGGNITSIRGSAIEFDGYPAKFRNLTISGGYLEGRVSGVQFEDQFVCSGRVLISGGTLKGIGPVPNATTYAGDYYGLSFKSGNGGSCNVIVTGGLIDGARGGIYNYNPLLNLTISGGVLGHNITYNRGSYKGAINSEGGILQINGGKIYSLSCNGPINITMTDGEVLSIGFSNSGGNVSFKMYGGTVGKVGYTTNTEGITHSGHSPVPPYSTSIQIFRGTVIGTKYAISNYAGSGCKLLLSGGVLSGDASDIYLSVSNVKPTEAIVSLKDYVGDSISIKTYPEKENLYIAENVPKDGLVSLVSNNYIAVYDSANKIVKIGVPHTHNYEKNVTSPTCTMQGYTTYICECGDTYIADYTGIDSNIHNYTSEVTIPATHLAEGVKIFACSDCGDSYTESIEKIAEHTYESVVTVPTCTEKGYTTYTCECGESYTADYVSPIWHVFTSYVYNNDATEYIDGTKTAYCDYGCGITHTIKEIGTAETPTIIDIYPGQIKEYNLEPGTAVIFRVHSMEDVAEGYWFSLKYPKELTPPFDPNNYEENLPIKWCDYYDEINYGLLDGGMGDCLEGEEKFSPHISRAGQIYYIEVVSQHDEAIEISLSMSGCCTPEYPTEAHTPATAVEENHIAPTCTENGSKDVVVYCSVCDDEISRETVILEATGHSYTSEVTTPATHLAEGVKTFTCDACDDSYTEAIEKNAEHTYTAVVTKPTCEEKGYTTYTCECGDTYVSDYVDATAHDYKATVTRPTCTEKGYTTNVCSSCGDSYIDNYKGATGHDYDNGIITTKPTCTKTGVKTFTCANCGDIYTEEVDELGHTSANAVEENYIAPSCTEKGSKDVVVYCSACDEELSRETVVIDATGHADNDGDGYCDEDNELLDPTVVCTCNCHKTGLSKFFFNFILFFQRLFGSNKTCACGIAHY